MVYKIIDNQEKEHFIKDDESLKEILQECIMNLSRFKVACGDTIVFFSNGKDYKDMCNVVDVESETKLVDSLTKRIKYLMR